MTTTAPPPTLWALSDPTRIEIMDRVAMGTELTVTQLANVMPITRQAISRHVKTLEAAGLLTQVKDGRAHIYRAHLDPLGDASDWLAERSVSWRNALDRLSAYLDGDQPES